MAIMGNNLIMVLLVVEDDPDIAELIAYNLRQEGFEVLKADCAASALTKASRHNPDLILLDLMLPDLDGISLCEILRKAPETATTPILMLTAWTTQQSRNLGLEAGANDYMGKPFSPRELVSRVKALLEPKACWTPDGSP